MFKNSPKFTKIYQNLPKFIKIHQNSSKFTKTRQTLTISWEINLKDSPNSWLNLLTTLSKFKKKCTQLNKFINIIKL